MLSAEELFKYRTGLRQSMPPKGGEKEYMPDGSWLQEKCIENFHQDRERALAEPRVVRRHDLVKGEWKPKHGLVELVHELRNFWEHMGFNDKKRKWLYPEEALFLMETSVLEIWYQGLPVSIQEAYTLLFTKTLQLEIYQVYAHLRRIGYVVLRHQGRYQFTKYERTVGLDKHNKAQVSKKQNKLKQKQERRNKNTKNNNHQSGKDGTDNQDVDEVHVCKDNVCDNFESAKKENEQDKNSHHSGDEEKHFTEIRTEQNDKEIKQNALTEDECMKEQENDLRETKNVEGLCSKVKIPSNLADGTFEDSKGFPVENVHSNNGEIDVEMTESTETKVLSQESDVWFKSAYVVGACETFSGQHEIGRNETNKSEQSHAKNMSIIQSQSKLSHWNFDKIRFPNFKSDKMEVSVCKPNSVYTPQGKDLDFTSDIYTFNKTKFINTKKEKSKQKLQDRAEANLEYSYPEIMTGWHKVKKTCRNWKEYKVALATEKGSWDRSKVFPHLFGDQVEPLVRPELANSTYALLEQLKIVEEDIPARTDTKPNHMPDFDVYAPSTKFKKTSPGVPDFRVVVTRNSDPPPDLGTISEITSYLNDEASLRFAVVDSGNVAFYAMTDCLFQQDISLG